MESTVIVAIITGFCSIAGVVISNIISNNKMQSNLDKAQAVTDTKLETLTREVREHNNFAMRIPVIEEKLHSLGSRVSSLERSHNE